MPFKPSGLAALPAEIAVFPLTGALLLPGGRLPLNIFEPRYLALVEASLAQGRSFGMIQPDPAAAAQAGAPGLYKVGCLGRLSSFSETDDGRLLISLTGIIRFQVAAELPGRDGYRRVRADYSTFAADLDNPAPSAELDRPALLDALRAYFRTQGIDANWEAIERLEDDALVTTLCMVCPFEPLEKQALLEAPDPASRAAMLVAMLRMDSLPGTGQDVRPS
ncbi:peptidase S16 [Roseomonas sp. KE2513]|uniref:LON peptidase substrate-binding domain-containing protein n=1 Tax=Roseomonas sp. KE2513 TaxID=2479202 RepID=UPI0018DFF989|nr:LON peptidase substrate-binding domain-containing protein [Roseomonas sp. KE2513]MBI0535695.1 peptidase S16 [Roseomonas sp. KE2513]